MRSFLALGLFMAMCASVDAATAYHSRPRHHASVRHAYGMVPNFVVRPSQAVIPSYVTPGGVYRDDSVPGGLRTDHDDPSAYNDPSKFGGAWWNSLSGPRPRASAACISPKSGGMPHDFADRAGREAAEG